MLKPIAPFADFDALLHGLSPTGANLAKRRLDAGVAYSEALWKLPSSWRNGAVVVPFQDMVRFGCDLTTDPSAGPPERGPFTRLMNFEVARAHGLLDSADSALAELPVRERLRKAHSVGVARARLQALTRVPYRFDEPGPSPWRVSELIATVRTLRRVSHGQRSG